jgi:hypothetical protein
MSTNTVRLHRVLRATPEKAYRAFLDADAMVKWLPPNGFTGKVHHLDARVGGTRPTQGESPPDVSGVPGLRAPLRTDLSLSFQLAETFFLGPGLQELDLPLR